MRVLVCGPRDMDGRHRRLVEDSLLGAGATWVIEGGAGGADHLAWLASKTLGLASERFFADWQKHGRAAGPIRNRRMLDLGKPDLVLAFVPSTGITKGTADMVRRARKAGVEVREVVFEP